MDTNNAPPTTTTADATRKNGFLPDSFFQKVDEFLEEDYLFLDADEDQDADTDDTDDTDTAAEEEGTKLSHKNSVKSGSLGESLSSKKGSVAAHSGLSFLPKKSALKKCSSYNSLLVVDNRACEQEMIPIDTQKSAWNALPPPKQQQHTQQATIRTVGSSPSLLETNSTVSKPTKSTHTLKRNNVSFTDIEIRDYNMTLGDHPSCSYGTPVSLDWEYTQSQPINLDNYERHRPERRARQQLHMDSFRRQEIARQAGFSRGDIRKTHKNVTKARRQRATTLSRLPLMPLEDMVESATRKLKRLKLLKRGSDKQGKVNVNHKSASTTTTTTTTTTTKQEQHPPLTSGWNILRRSRSTNDLM
uniref:Uncharacterized protein n=1 Tax=Amphora coffeiformis TaxID=265554 RepID=A0A7S3P1A5_9STRA|mmetsp:Transcript_25537/g.48367  ORF Transcript_25537/g.48367 Transcript_25537/m.48367 type:complete len:359 (-) Transcript_25537:280-1356(-)|eukprot:scaffold20398_cov184-Amphora_coffeaeformis.AAC.1